MWGKCRLYCRSGELRLLLAIYNCSVVVQKFPNWTELQRALKLIYFPHNSFQGLSENCSFFSDPVIFAPHSPSWFMSLYFFHVLLYLSSPKLLNKQHTKRFSFTVFTTISTTTTAAVVFFLWLLFFEWTRFLYSLFSVLAVSFCCHRLQWISFYRTVEHVSVSV